MTEELEHACRALADAQHEQAHAECARAALAAELEQQRADHREECAALEARLADQADALAAAVREAEAKAAALATAQQEIAVHAAAETEVRTNLHQLEHDLKAAQLAAEDQERAAAAAARRIQSLEEVLGVARAATAGNGAAADAGPKPDAADLVPRADLLDAENALRATRQRLEEADEEAEKLCDQVEALTARLAYTVPRAELLAAEEALQEARRQREAAELRSAAAAADTDAAHTFHTRVVELEAQVDELREQLAAAAHAHAPPADADAIAALRAELDHVRGAVHRIGLRSAGVSE